MYKGNKEIKNIHIGDKTIKYGSFTPPVVEYEWKEQLIESNGYLTNPYVFYNSTTDHKEGEITFLTKVTYASSASARVGLRYAEASSTNVTFSSIAMKSGDVVEIKLVYEGGKANVYSKRNEEVEWTFGNEFTRYSHDYLALIGFSGSKSTEIWLQK